MIGEEKTFQKGALIQGVPAEMINEGRVTSDTMREGRLGYNSYNKRYGLLSSDLWIDTGFHCGECLEVLVDDQWVKTRMEMNLAREWYLVGTPYCGDLEYVRARIPE